MLSSFTPITSFSVVIPVFNEEATLPLLYERLKQACQSVHLPYELIFVDDGSNDNSLEWLLELVQSTQIENIQVIELKRNYGQHAGIMAGFSHAQGDAVITLDADLQNPPEEIPRLLAALADADLVGSIREWRQDSWLRRLASKLVNYAIRRITGQSMQDYGCMLRGYRHSIVQSMLAYPPQRVFIPLLANKHAKRTVEIKVAHEKRRHGVSKYNFWQLFTLWFDLLSSVDRSPFRYAVLFGSVLATAGCLGLMGFILSAFFRYRMLNWTEVGFSSLAIMFGVQFIVLSIVGEHVGQIYSEVSAQLKYLIKRRITSCGCGLDTRIE